METEADQPTTGHVNKAPSDLPAPVEPPDDHNHMDDPGEIGTRHLTTFALALSEHWGQVKNPGYPLGRPRGERGSALSQQPICQLNVVT